MVQFIVRFSEIKLESFAAGFGFGHAFDGGRLRGYSGQQKHFAGNISFAGIAEG
jgi:hypothetical protein